MDRPELLDTIRSLGALYVMEASDEEFDTEEVRKLVKRLDELDPIPLPWKSDEEALKDFWEYCEERQREERIIADMKISYYLIMFGSFVVNYFFKVNVVLIILICIVIGIVYSIYERRFMQ